MANHITQWKPEVQYTNKYNERKHFPVNTYAEIKRRMKEFLRDSKGNEVMVSRSRRGEWGEWFEYWSMCNDTPVIMRQGWM